MRRHPSIAALAVALSVLVIGCGSGSAPASGSTAPGSATPAGSTAASVDPSAAPSEAPSGASATPSETPAGASTEPGGPITGSCDPFEGGAEPPPTATQTALLAKIPKTIDGEPVRDPKTYQAMQVFCSGSDPGDELVAAVLDSFGVDLRPIVMGQFGATVDGYATLVEVAQAPGVDAALLTQVFAALGASANLSGATPANVGGKDVLVLEEGGGRRYQYVDGDTWYSFAVETEGQAETLLSALE